MKLNATLCKCSIMTPEFKSGTFTLDGVLYLHCKSEEKARNIVSKENPGKMVIVEKARTGIEIDLSKALENNIAVIVEPDEATDEDGE